MDGMIVWYSFTNCLFPGCGANTIAGRDLEHVLIVAAAWWLLTADGRGWKTSGGSLGDPGRGHQRFCRMGQYRTCLCALVGTTLVWIKYIVAHLGNSAGWKVNYKHVVANSGRALVIASEAAEQRWDEAQVLCSSTRSHVVSPYTPRTIAVIRLFRSNYSSKTKLESDRIAKM